MKRLLIYIYITMLATLSACTSDSMVDDYAEGVMTTVTLDISALSMDAADDATRATGDPEDPAYNIEKIHSWWVVFVDKNNNVKKIVSRSSELTTYVEEEQTNCDIPAGTYTLYSFANITPTELKTKIGVEFTEGSACPTGIDSKTIALSNDWDKSTDIPMSGKQSVTVTGRANEVFSVEVVRMLAKLEFQFSNESRKDVTLKNLIMTYTLPSEISLLPNYTYLDSGWPLESGEGLTASTTTRTYTTTLTAYSGGTPASATDYYYMMQSQANTNVSKRYLFNVNISRNDGHDDENLLFALSKNLYSIYRNDHVVIPIVISDFKVKLDVNFYPPIAGYPAVISQNKTETEFYCEFATQGTFAIVPSVTDTYNSYNLVYNDAGHDPYYTYAITAVSDPVPSIFSTAPYIETGSGEIVGELSTNQGTAYVDIEVTVHRTGAAKQIYDRRVYFVRKNP